jgi:hypothetical protein
MMFSDDRIVGLNIPANQIERSVESCAAIADAWAEFDGSRAGKSAARNIAALLRSMNDEPIDHRLKAHRIKQLQINKREG